MKGGFYGVYGINFAGVYDNWNKVLQDKSKFIGFKVKKFFTKKLAVDFIVHGLIFDYHIFESESVINSDTLLSSPINISMNVEKLAT